MQVNEAIPCYFLLPGGRGFAKIALSLQAELSDDVNSCQRISHLLFPVADLPADEGTRHDAVRGSLNLTLFLVPAISYWTSCNSGAQRMQCLRWRATGRRIADHALHFLARLFPSSEEQRAQIRILGRAILSVRDAQQPYSNRGAAGLFLVGRRIGAIRD